MSFYNQDPSATLAQQEEEAFWASYENYPLQAAALVQAYYAKHGTLEALVEQPVSPGTDEFSEIF